MGFKWILIGSLLGLIGILLSYFGAHLFKNKIEDGFFHYYQQGTDYLMYYTIVIILVQFIINSYNYSSINYVGWLFLSGVLIFSSSLIMIAFTSNKSFGMITPIGGTLLTAGWIVLSYIFVKRVL